MGTEGVEPPQSSQTCTAKHKSNQGPQRAPPLLIHPSIKKYSARLWELPSLLLATSWLLSFQRFPILSALAKSKPFTVLPTPLYGTFIRKDQDRSYREQPMQLAFGLSSIFVLLAIGGGSPNILALTEGIEPPTGALQMHCSTYWAKSACGRRPILSSALGPPTGSCLIP